MRKLNLLIVVLILANILLSPRFLQAVEYPIISLGLNGGYAKSELAEGIDSRIFLRYSLEAYIPGFQIDVSYGQTFFGAIEDTTITNIAQDDTTFKTRINNIYPAVSGTFHFKPFGEKLIVYFGGGAQFHFLSANRTLKEKYWDNVGEKFQEREISSRELLNQVKFGYHYLGGLRLLLGKFGTLDVEVRQNIINLTEDDWEEGYGRNRWGKESWDQFSVNAGLTIFIF